MKKVNEKLKFWGNKFRSLYSNKASRSSIAKELREGGRSEFVGAVFKAMCTTRLFPGWSRPLEAAFKQDLMTFARRWVITQTPPEHHVWLSHTECNWQVLFTQNFDGTWTKQSLLAEIVIFEEPRQFSETFASWREVRAHIMTTYTNYLWVVFQDDLPDPLPVDSLSLLDVDLEDENHDS
jgi:hypothetical protein